MRSRSPAVAPAMLFQLAGSPVQRRGPRYTSAPHEATIITLPPRLLAPRLWENGATFFRSEPPSMRRLGLMFCIKQIVNASPSPPVKAISQKTCRGFYGLHHHSLGETLQHSRIYISCELNQPNRFNLFTNYTTLEARLVNTKVQFSVQVIHRSFSLGYVEKQMCTDMRHETCQVMLYKERETPNGVEVGVGGWVRTSTQDAAVYVLCETKGQC